METNKFHPKWRAGSKLRDKKNGKVDHIEHWQVHLGSKNFQLKIPLEGHSDKSQKTGTFYLPKNPSNKNPPKVRQESKKSSGVLGEWSSGQVVSRDSVDGLNATEEDLANAKVAYVT